MMLNLKKGIDTFYRKNKIVSISIFIFCISSLTKLIVLNVSSYLSMLHTTQDLTIENTSKIKNLEKTTDRHEFIYKEIIKKNYDLVSRKSFNDYILKKDKDYNLQIYINNNIYSRLGYIEGVMKISKDK